MIYTCIYYDFFVVEMNSFKLVFANEVINQTVENK